MRKTIALVAFILATVCAGEPKAESIKREHYSNFQTIIQAMGYVCNSCEGGNVLGQGSRGTNFRVYCNDNQQVYFVVIASGGKNFCVEPWNKKGTKCEE